MKSIILPEFNQEIAELVGIMYGDESLSYKNNNTYLMRISFNKRELEYSNYVNLLFLKNYGFKLKVVNRKSEIMLYFYSKQLVEYFHNVLHVSYSPKILREIPDYIMKDKQFLVHFIRGLFDTDGCITHQRQGKYNYVLIKICTKHHEFAFDIKRNLAYLGINSFVCRKIDYHWHEGFDVVVRNTQCNVFFNVIGSRNMKNILKWEQNGAAGIRISEAFAPNNAFPDPLVYPKGE